VPDHGNTLFAGAAPHYGRHRPPYPVALYPLLAGRLSLDRSATVLDLGCGPGTLTVPLAAICGHVVAVDPSAEMLDAALAAVDAAGCDNVELIRSRAERLSDRASGLDGAVLGRSFHWMDREAVLDELDRRLAPSAGLALIRTESLEAPTWRDVVRPIVRRYLGPERRARVGVPPASDHAEMLAASRFSDVEAISLAPVDHVWTVDSVAGYLYSVSYSAPPLFGDRLEEFDAELRAALAETLPPEGAPDPIVTRVLIAHRRSP